MDKETRNIVLAKLREGCTRRDAMLLADIPIQQHKNIAQGDFLHDMRKAEAGWRKKIIDIVVDLAQDGRNCVPALQILEARDPSEWSDPGTMKRQSEDDLPQGPLAEAFGLNE